MHVHDATRSGEATGARPDMRRRLGIALVLTTVYTVAEVAGGILTGSLALLADAGHMMTDNLALGLALLAAWFARRPPDPARTYGWQRVEILAALANGVGLVVVCGFIVWEAITRLRSPSPVAAGAMAAVAAGGLVVNLIGAALLHGRGHDLNVRAAFLHLVGDTLGSVGALAAAAMIALRGWLWADPAASVFIAALVAVGAIRLTLESVNVLMEGAPSHVDPDEIRVCLLAVPGVGAVHDLHVWSLAGGAPLLTAHLVTERFAATDGVLREATRRLVERFGIRHATLQVEPPDFNIVGEVGLVRPGDAVRDRT